jgi:molecular chaperone GrpE
LDMSWRRWTTKDEEGQQEGTAGADAEQRPEDLLAHKDKEIAELTDTLKRLQAEFENYKKRTDKDWADKVKLANQRLVMELLPVLDSLDKAVQDSMDDPPETRKGLEGLRRQLLQVLQREGLREIKADGKLDPFAHEVLICEESEDAEDCKILEVLQKGYSLNSRPIRPARVKVAKRKAPVTTEEQRQKESNHYHDNQLKEEQEPEEECEKREQE